MNRSFKGKIPFIYLIALSIPATTIAKGIERLEEDIWRGNPKQLESYFTPVELAESALGVTIKR